MSFPVKVKIVLAGLAVAGGGAAAIFLGPAGPAVGQSSQPIQLAIQVNSPATLVARGAGAEVTLTTNCSGPTVATANLLVILSERSTSAIGEAAVSCTGSNQTVQVLVTPEVGRVIRKGTAIASASINACTADLNICSGQEAQSTIQVGS